MDPTDNQQTELLRLIWTEMKAVKSSVDTKLDAVRSEIEANRMEISKLNEKFDDLRGDFGDLKGNFDLVRRYMAESEMRSATMLVELRRERTEHIDDLRTRVERLEEHAGLAR